MHLAQVARVFFVQITSGLGEFWAGSVWSHLVWAGVPPSHEHPHRVWGMGHATSQVLNVLAEWTHKKLDGFHLGVSLAGELWGKCWLLETQAYLATSRVLSECLLYVCVCVCVFPSGWFSCVHALRLHPPSAQGVLFITRVGHLPHLSTFPQRMVMIRLPRLFSFTSFQSYCLFPPEWSVDSMSVDPKIGRNASNSKIIQAWQENFKTFILTHL